MIELLRVDDTLIHGRVALIWTRKLKIDEIIIVNNEIVNDEFMKMTLELAKPSNVTLVFLTFKEVENYIKNLVKEKRIMIVVEKLLDAQKICSIFNEIKSVNIGGLKQNPFKKTQQIIGGVCFTIDDYQLCRKFKKQGIEIEIRKVPDEVKIIVDV